jgi:Cu+-exporting ATPase
MTNTLRAFFAIAATLLIGIGTSARAADPLPTTIKISDLDCPSCAKKVVAKLLEVEGVAKVETDVDTQTAKVTPKAKAVLSPKALWEAVVKAKHTPEKLEGPSGKFTELPKS